MDTTIWTKTNGSALRMYQKKEGVFKPGSDPLNLKVPAVKTEIYRIFFSTRCVNMWNEIPQDVKNAKNLNSFKNKLDEWLNN